MESSLDRVLNKIKEMPSLSPTVAKVIQVANDINASPRELVTVIKMDPVLSGRVIKLVNSSYFGLPTSVTSLERAIIMLGVNTIKNLALSTAVVDQFAGKKTGSSFNMDEFWKHSLAVAVGAKIVAIVMKVPKKFQEEYFISGLLHDLGKIVMARFFGDSMDFILRRVEADSIPMLTAEKDEMDLTHPEIGEIVGKEWKLPESITKALRYHHEPVFNDPDIKITGAIYVSNIYCNKLKLGFSGEKVTMEVEDAVWKKLEITEDGCIAKFQHIKSELEKAMTFLQV